MIEILWMMSVQSCSLILIVLLVRKALQKYPKIYSYGLWALVLLRLLCPVFMESRLSLQPDFRNSRILQTAGQLSEIQTESENDAIGQTGLSENNFGAMAQADAQKAEPQGAELQKAEPQKAEPQKAEPQESRKTSDEKHETVFAAAAEQIRSGGVSAVLKVLYLTGLCIAAGCFGFQYFYMKRKVSLAVREKGNVWLCEAVRSPFVMGIVRPRIYLPFAISGDEKRHILKHERVHIRHKDPLVRFLGILVCCLHWWNPLVWYAVHKMNQDMEMFCDEAAMSGVPFAERRAYSKTLLHFAMKQSGLPVALSFGETNTEMRVKNILKKKKKSIAACIAVILLAAVCIVVFFTVPQSSSEGNAGVDLDISLKNPEAGDGETEADSTEDSGAGEEENTETGEGTGIEEAVQSSEEAAGTTDQKNLEAGSEDTDHSIAGGNLPAEEEYYSLATSFSKTEVEAFAREVREQVLDHDWEGLSEKISYPVTIAGTVYPDAEEFLKSDWDSIVPDAFFDGIREESCENMFVNWQGIMMGESGQIWIAEVLNGDLESQGLKITGINVPF